jgi:lysyl-tRNA synthetase class 2
VDWRPTASLEVLRHRATLLARTRARFASDGVLEVETPALRPLPVTDRHIDSLAVLQADGAGRQYLHTSPEYAMKRLLAAGFPDIYQICRVYRDGESGARHRPEFTMIEWYRRGASLDDIVNDTTGLLDTLLRAAPGEPYGLTVLGRPVRMTFDAALRRHGGFDSDADLQTLRNAAGDAFPAALGDDRDALLDWIFSTRIAPAFDPDRLTVIDRYPAAQAALAEIDGRDGRALRFEVYCADMELANGFVELRDAGEQRQRFERDNALRDDDGKPRIPLDEALLAALAAGLPRCAGVAVGLDRIMMLACGSEDIGDVQSFDCRGWSRP